MQHVAVIADSHFDETSRFQECIDLHDWIAADLEKRKVDLIIHTGDVFERKSTPAERIAFANWLRRAASTAPVVIVKGNHDVLGDLAIFGKLETKYSVTIEEAAGVHVVRGIAVAAVAWPRRAHLLAMLKTDHDQTEQAAAEAMRNLLRGLGAQMAEHDGPKILAMHAMVRGSITSTGQPLVGCDFEIGLEDLALSGAQIVALGHVHAGQDFMHGDLPIVYPGSPRRTSFGETEDKGYLLLDVDAEGTALWERIVVPATAMFLLEDEWDGRWLVGWHGMPANADLVGAEVRCRYTVASDQRDAAKRAASEVQQDLYSRGASNVKIEEQVIATSRARAPEIVTARTVPEKLHALWAARKQLPPTERVEQLIQKVIQVEGEVAA